MAYDSDESGRVEVYLQSYPDPTGARRQVSSGGGSEPLWTRGGRELVFRRGDSVMVAVVDPRLGEAGTATLLFAGPYDTDPEWSAPRSYDATPDGQRLLLLKWPTGEVRRRVLVATRWFDELRGRVAGQRAP
jgi:Tol biopolymer transport system component